MESLLIVNLENKDISEDIRDFLNQFYKAYKADTKEQVTDVLSHTFIDLFLVIATNINDSIIALLKEIKSERHDLLPVIVCLPEINAHNQSLAFQQRILYLTAYPLNLSQLKKELANVSRMIPVTSDKSINLSGLYYEKDYLVKKIRYIERSRPKYLTIVYEEENGDLSEDEFFFKKGLKDFICRYGLEKHLIQVNQSYLVNPRLIKHIDKTDKTKLQVILTTGERLDVGQTYYKKMKKGVANDAK